VKACWGHAVHSFKRVMTTQTKDMCQCHKYFLMLPLSQTALLSHAHACVSCHTRWSVANITLVQQVTHVTLA